MKVLLMELNYAQDSIGNEVVVVSYGYIPICLIPTDQMFALMDSIEKRKKEIKHNHLAIFLHNIKMRMTNFDFQKWNEGL